MEAPRRKRFPFSEKLGRGTLRSAALACFIQALCALPAPSSLAEERYTESNDLTVGILPFSPASHGIPANASNSIRDIIASEITRRSGREKKGIRGIPILFAAPDAGADSENLPLCPLNFDGEKKFYSGVRQKEAEELAEICASSALRLARRGRDDESRQALTQAVIFSPAGQTSWEKKSLRMRNMGAEVRSKFFTSLKEARSSEQGENVILSVLSSSGDMEIFIDGLSAGLQPLLITGLSPGVHLIQGKSPALGQAASVFIRIPGKKSEKRLSTRLTAGAPGPLSDLIGLAGSGILSGETAGFARRVSSEAGTRCLIGGSLLKKGDDILLESFLFDSRRGSFHSMPPISFDPDLLTAGISARKFIAQVLPEVAGRCSREDGETSEKGLSGEAVPSQTIISSSNSASAPLTEISFLQLVRGARESFEDREKSSIRPRQPQKSTGGGNPRRPIDSRNAFGELRSRKR